MKSASQKNGSSNPPLSEFRKFILAILRRRVFLISLFLGIIALLIQLILSEFSWPQFYAFGFMFVGFAWSAYQAYRELSLAHQKVTSQITDGKKPRSALSILPVIGNKYEYSLSDPFFGKNHLLTGMQNTKDVKSHFDERGVFFVNGKVYYRMGKGSLEINIQLHNSGDLPFDILSMETDNNLNLNHFAMSYEGIFLHGKKLRLPLHLESGELITLQLRYRISINRGSNESLFAADFRSLPRSIIHEVSIDTATTGKNKETCTSEIKILSRPLIDLYVKQWREYDQEEYLVLAGYDLEGDI